MALSDYDTLAFNEDGKPCNGVFKTKSGTVVECYKNWIHIGHKKMWRKESSGLVFPWTGILRSGNYSCMFNELNFSVREAPQRGMFFLATWFADKKDHVIGGIVSSGYAARIPKKLRDKGIKSLDEWGSGSASGGGGKTEYFLISPKGREIKVDKYPWYWTGIKESTVTEFVKWASGELRDYIPAEKKWLSNIKKSGGLRFNQGDMFFAKHLGVSPQASKPGNANKPVIMKMVRSK